MTTEAEDRLRRALDDLLTTCWAEDIPVLDAVAESIEDWAALEAAEFYDSQLFEETDARSRLASAVSTLRFASRRYAVGSTPPETVLADALADWVREYGKLRPAISISRGSASGEHRR